jgi:hypothetical protein
MSTNKGAELRFTKGSYMGKTGWINEDGKLLDCYVHVIIHMGDGLEERLTKVRKTSMKRIADDRPAATREEAILQQHPDIEAIMEKLAAELAKCGLDRTKETARIVSVKLQEAIVAHRTKGSKATYRFTRFTDV